MIFFPRPVQTMEYSISVSTLFFCCFSYRLDTDFNRDSSTDTVFLLLFRGEMLPKRLLDRARLPLRLHFNIMRVLKLANHKLVLPQPDLRAQTIHASLLHVVLGASHVTPC